MGDLKMFSFGAEGFSGGEAGGSPGRGEGCEEASEDHTEGDINKGGVRSVPIDGPTKKSAVDNLHEDEGDSEAGNDS